MAARSARELCLFQHQLKIHLFPSNIGESLRSSNHFVVKHSLKPASCLSFLLVSFFQKSKLRNEIEIKKIQKLRRLDLRSE